MQVYSNTAPRSSTRTRLPYEERYSAIEYVNEAINGDGAVGETRYPINYEELYNLKGRLLTLVDATYTDPQQRKAQKNLVWQTLRAWMEDIERAGEGIFEPQDEADPASSTA